MLGFSRSVSPGRRHCEKVIPKLDSLESRVVPTLLGNSLFPADNPWNQQITNAPVAANSATLVNSIGGTRTLHADFGTVYDGALNGIPYNVVPGTQPRINVVIDAYPTESDLVPIPIPADAVIEGDPLPSNQNTSDRHLLVYDRDNNIVYETFNTRRPSETGDGQWHADSEAVWDMSQNSFRTPGFTSADAAGLPILPGLVRPDEVLDQGVITHALRFTVNRSRNTWVFPASHYAGSNDPTLPRMGERFRLRPDFDISGFSPANRVILQALKDYGMIVADNGSSWYVSGEPSSRWNDGDLHNLGQLHGSDFEAVDLTPQVYLVNPGTGSTAGGDLVTITGLNFSGGAGQTQVFFGDAAAAQVTVNDDGSITATAPAHAAGTVDVTVVSPYGSSAIVPGDQFTFTDSPLVYSLTFVLGLDNQVYDQRFNTAGLPLGGYSLAAPGQVKSFVAGHDSAGHQEIFVLGLDDQVYTLKFDAHGNPVGSYTQAAVGHVKSLTVGNDATGRPELFVIGLDDEVFGLKFDASGNSLGGYFLTTGGQVKSLNVGADAAGHPEVFVIGLDNQVYVLKFDADGNALGGYARAAVGQVKSVAVGHYAGGRPELFAIGLDDQVYALSFDAAGNPLGGYAPTAGGQVKSLSVGNDASGRPEVFVIGLDDQVYALKFDADGHAVGGYALTTGGRVKSLAVGHSGGGCPEVFALGLDDQLYAERFDATGNPISGLALTTPGVIQTVCVCR